MTSPPRISVVIPVRNGAIYLRDCLRSLAQSTIPIECVVVNDASDDDSEEVARSAGATVITTGEHCGPARARNLGAAAAKTEILFFIDADVCVQADTAERIVNAFDKDPTLDALIGSYDDSPVQRDFLSQYRNLLHHYTHQHAAQDASTFWSGCGAIRKQVFLDHGGFDVSFYRPSVEDIELGFRLKRANRRLILDRTLTVRHLKEWSFFGMLRTDVLDRGVPWTELILRDRHLPNDLNLSISQRVSAALGIIIVGLGIVLSVLTMTTFVTPMLAVLFLLLGQYEAELDSKRIKRGIAASVLLAAVTAMSFWAGDGWIAVVCLLAFLLLLWRQHYYSPELGRRRWLARLTAVYVCAAILWIATEFPRNPLQLALFISFGTLILLNSRFYVFLAAKRGRLYAISAIPFHLLFFFYCGISFIAGSVRYFARRLLRRSRGLQARIPLPDQPRRTHVRVPPLASRGASKSESYRHFPAS